MQLIQLLYIIPVVAFGLMGFLVAWVIQYERMKTVPPKRQSQLKQEVEDYNSGSRLADIAPESATKQRMHDIEATIALVNSVLSSQQRIIEKFEGQSAASSKETTVLRERLAELSREYDLIAGENKALRATVRQFLRRHGQSLAVPAEGGYPKPREIIGEEEFFSEAERRLFEDTKQLRILGLGGESTDAGSSSTTAID